MKTLSRLVISCLLAAFLGLCGIVFAQSSGITSLRNAAVDEPVNLGNLYQQVEQRMQRNYRQQPPLIPHGIFQYQIDLRTNQCLSCHDWTKAGERNAPTLSMTHYLDRDGYELDHVAGTRYFCNQCHVPQVAAPDLVNNLFRSSASTN
ncbi:MAG: nitrate reductase cytochrome c-type subunit [Gammaproteobacteria bacterium]|nr:nitrate reductase cytochrome c-type subunit [Gammaproteobacteria bacterium]